MPSDRLPRELVDGVWWLSDCLLLPHDETVLHAYHSAYLLVGEDSSLIVDTGHPKDWAALRAQAEQVLATGAPPVRYIFPTHAEVPPSASLGRWLTQFPDAVAVGDLRDYHLIFPQL